MAPPVDGVEEEVRYPAISIRRRLTARIKGMYYNSPSPGGNGARLPRSAWLRDQM